MDIKEDFTWFTPPEAKYTERLVRNSVHVQAVEQLVRDSRMRWVEEAHESGFVAQHSQWADLPRSRELRWGSAFLAWHNEGSGRECIAVRLSNRQLISICGLAMVAYIDARENVLHFDEYTRYLASAGGSLPPDMKPLSAAGAESITDQLFEELLKELAIGATLVSTITTHLSGNQERD